MSILTAKIVKNRPALKGDEPTHVKDLYSKENQFIDKVGIERGFFAVTIILLIASNVIYEMTRILQGPAHWILMIITLFMFIATLTFFGATVLLEFRVAQSFSEIMEIYKKYPNLTPSEIYPNVFEIKAQLRETKKLLLKSFLQILILSIVGYGIHEYTTTIHSIILQGVVNSLIVMCLVWGCYQFLLFITSIFVISAQRRSVQ